MSFKSGYLEIDLAGALLFTGGEIAAVANPEDGPIIIQDVKIVVDTPSTGAANIAVGLAADKVTSDNSLIDALAINGAVTDKAYHGMTALAAKGEAIVWGENQFLTATGSADSSDFVGRLLVAYVRVG